MPQLLPPLRVRRYTTSKSALAVRKAVVKVVPSAKVSLKLAEGETLEITGDLSYLSGLAETFRNFATYANSSTHIHLLRPAWGMNPF